MKKENEGLAATVQNEQKTVKEMKLKLEQQQNDYDTLKMAKMLEVTDGNLQGAKDRLAKLIRDVNKCIAILSDENQ